MKIKLFYIKNKLNGLPLSILGFLILTFGSSLLNEGHTSIGKTIFYIGLLFMAIGSIVFIFTVYRFFFGKLNEE